MRQMQIMLFVGMFSPIVRVLPRMCAHISGSAAWLAPLAALLPTVLFFSLCWKMFLYENEGDSLADMMTDILGKKIGKVLAAIF